MNPTVILEIIVMGKVIKQLYTHFTDTWTNYTLLAEWILLIFIKKDNMQF